MKLKYLIVLLLCCQVAKAQIVLTDSCFSSIAVGTTFSNSADITNDNADLGLWNSGTSSWSGFWPGANITIAPPTSSCFKAIFTGNGVTWTTGGEGFGIRLVNPLVSGVSYSFTVTYVSTGFGSNGAYSPQVSTNNSGVVNSSSPVGTVVGNLPPAGYTWLTSTFTFTATPAQNGDDWLIFCSGPTGTSGLISSFCNCSVLCSLFVNLGPDTSVCAGQPVTLNAGHAGGTFAWSTTQTSQSITVDSAGQYSVIVTDSGCTGRDTIHVTNHGGTGSSIAHSICPGSTYTFYGRTLTTAGTYYDTLTSSTGCDSIITLTLSTTAPVGSSSSQSICSGSSYNFYGRTLTTAGTYYDTLTSAAGCDSIITLTLATTNAVQTAISGSICNGSSYNFNGQTLSSSGTYRDTLASASGCDSIVTLTLSTVSSVGSAISDSICNGESYIFGVQALTVAGTYYDTLTSASGCDSIVTLTLTVLNVSAGAISAVLCPGQTYSFGGQTLSTAGTYTETLTSVNGCDSIVTLTLSATPPVGSSISQSICNGTTYTFYGQTLSTAGTYYDTLTSAAGCDSIITLTLTTTNSLQTAISGSICNGSSYNFNGQNLSTAGTYADTLTSVGGCDSIVTLTLSTAPTVGSSTSQSICNGASYNFYGRTLTTAGTYYDTLSSAAGCDSIITLTLTAANSIQTAISGSICIGSSYNFGGQALTAAGTYYDSLTSVAGCDSIIILTLTVLPVSASALTQTICGGSYQFGSSTLTASGTYIDTFANTLGCDSIVTLTLTLLAPGSDSISAAICGGRSYTYGGQTYTTPGTYYDTLTTAAGCDSIVALHLSVSPPPSASFITEPPGNIFSLGTPIIVTDQSSAADSILWLLNGQAVGLTNGNQLPINDTGTYCIRLIATSSLGCSDTSGECITVYNNSFYMPNAFTPNGDGVNDYITVYGPKESLKYIGIKIFDRWGEKVFESTDLNFEWDGSYRGAKLEPGLYVYELDMTFLTGSSIHNKGSISLIR